jgi:hypothetical protein
MNTIGARHSWPKNQLHAGVVLVVQREREQAEEDEGSKEPDGDAHRRRF